MANASGLKHNGIMSLKFAVIGEKGQLARALKVQIEAQSYDAVFFNRTSLDLSASPHIILKFMDKLEQVDAVILAAAYTAVDDAENNQDIAMAINGRAPGVIAQACHKRGIPLIHFSTDYVFNGKAVAPYEITETPDPINFYGVSKREGELNIQTSKCQHTILRTSWVFDGTGKNFLTTMLRLAETRPSLNIVSDQLGRPTYAGHLAQAGLSAARSLIAGNQESVGIFHVSNIGSIISWADFAEAIFRNKSLAVTVNRIPSSAYPTRATRPAFSALSTKKFESVFDYKLPSWQEGLKAAFKER